jgi:hypothetical protein
VTVTVNNGAVGDLMGLNVGGSAASGLPAVWKQYLAKLPCKKAHADRV